MCSWQHEKTTKHWNKPMGRWSGTFFYPACIVQTHFLPSLQNMAKHDGRWLWSDPQLYNTVLFVYWIGYNHFVWTFKRHYKVANPPASLHRLYKTLLLFYYSYIVPEQMLEWWRSFRHLSVFLIKFCFLWIVLWRIKFSDAPLEWKQEYHNAKMLH